MKLVSGAKGLVRAFDAAVGGLVVGHQAREGRRLNATTAALVIAVPLLWKRRMFSLALAAATALLAYRYGDQIEPLLDLDGPSSGDAVPPRTGASVH